MPFGESSGGRQPILSSCTREVLARDLLADADLPPFAPPRWLALRLGFRLRVRSAHAADADAEATTAGCLVYPWLDDPRALGGEQHLALAEGYLLRRGVPHRSPDVALLALDVALPMEERPRGAAYLIWHQWHLPVATIRRVSADLALGP